MFEMIQYRFAVVAVFTFTLVFNRTHSDVTNFNKRGDVDVFNLLLGLYKLNPLKASKVYKNFSDKILSRGEKLITPMQTDSSEKNEITYQQKPTIQDFNEIESLIYPKYDPNESQNRPSHNSIGTPEYDIENVDIEKFNVDVVVNDKLADAYAKKNRHKTQAEEYNILMSHLTSDINEISDDLPSTKMIPVNDSAISKVMMNTKLFPLKKLHDKRNLDDIFGGIADGTVIQVDNDIQETPIMNNNLQAADVIVL